jgi:hypothetical protein
MAEQTMPLDFETLVPTVPCEFCAGRISADTFEYVYWSGDKRLLAARCRGCHQRTVLSFKLWRRKMAMSVPSRD